MTKNRSTVVSALILLTGLAGQSRAEGAPDCRQWQLQKLSTETCLCAGQVKRGDERAQECLEASASNAPSGRPQAGAGAADAAQRMGEAMAMIQELSFDNSAASRALPDAPKPQPRKESRWGLKGAEVAAGISRSGQAGNGPSLGGALTYFQSRHFSLDAGYVRHDMKELQTSVNDAGPNPMGGPDLQAVSVTQPKITWNSIAGMDYYPHDLGEHVRPYARVEGGYVGVPANVDVQTQIMAGGQLVQNLGSAPQPTGNGNYGAAAVGGGAELKLHADSRVSLDVRYMRVPQLGSYPTVGLRISRFRKKRPAEDQAQ